MKPPPRAPRPRLPRRYPDFGLAIFAGTGRSLADAEAITLLEEQVIPWQDNGADAQEIRRSLRQKSAAYPLLAAEGLLRRSACPGASGAGEGGSAGEFDRQTRQILRWGKRRARLIDRALEDRLAALGGVEHEVFLDDASRRWLKLTMPGRAGKELHARENGFGLRPTLLTEDALPSEYLRRLRLANERLGDDFWLHGVMAHPGGPRLVVSQRHIRGEAPGAGDIAGHFAEAGYIQVNWKTFFQPRKNLLVSDAHVGNVLRTGEGIAPFDLCVQEPRDALRRAVEPSPALDFDDWGDGQAGLL